MEWRPHQAKLGSQLDFSVCQPLAVNHYVEMAFACDGHRYCVLSDLMQPFCAHVCLNFTSAGGCYLSFCNTLLASLRPCQAGCFAQPACELQTELVIGIRFSLLALCFLVQIQQRGSNVDVDWTRVDGLSWSTVDGIPGIRIFSERNPANVAELLLRHIEGQCGLPDAGQAKGQ